MSTPDKEEIERLFEEAKHDLAKSQHDLAKSKELTDRWEKEEIERLFEEARYLYVKSQEISDRFDGDPVRIQFQRIQDAEKGRKVRESLVKRDEARTRRTTADIGALEDRVRTIHERRPDLSWCRVCEIVGERLDPPLTGRRVRDLARGAWWTK